MQPIQFFIAGMPAGKPRPRLGRFGGHARVYSPKDKNGFQTAVSFAAIPHRPKVLLKGPVRADFCFWFRRPKSHYRANGELKPTAPVWYTSKPDRDNCDKLILDALTKCGFWRDDAQVCAGTILKKYVVNDAKPGVLVSVGEAADPREARRSLNAVVSSHCAHIRNPYTLEEICEQVAGAEYNAELMLQHLLLWCSANDKIQP